MNQDKIFTCFLFLYIKLLIGESQRTYDCVQSGSQICSDSGGSTGIDPRIVTPPSNQQQNTECPAGYASCRNSKCGITSIFQSTDGGRARRGGFPWQAYLIGNGAYIGGGVLIDQFHVLTAAHKISNISNYIEVVMGMYEPGNYQNTQVANAASIAIHVNYDVTTLKNDIALIKLSTPINFNANTVKACLPAYTASTGSQCYVSGWGQSTFTLNDASTNPLKFARVNIIPTNICRQSFTSLGVDVSLYLDEQNEICAGGQSQRDACTQDGGSPLVCLENNAYTVRGLVIWGKNCGQSNVYGVYVRVFAYLNWIQCAISCLDGLTNCSNCPAYMW